MIDDQTRLRYVGHVGCDVCDVCDEYFLVASKNLTTDEIIAKIKCRDIEGIEVVDYDHVDDLVDFFAIETVPTERWTVVKLFTYG